MKRNDLRQYGLKTLFFIVATLNQAQASEQAAFNCNILGSLLADPMRQAAPVEYQSIDSNALLENCLEAIATEASSTARGRYYLQLGRGYLKAGNSASAILSFKTSVSLGYPAGYFALGVTYLLGDDIEKDDQKARKYLLKALDSNVHWASKALSELHGNPMSRFYDINLSNEYQAMFENNFE